MLIHDNTLLNISCGYNDYFISAEYQYFTILVTKTIVMLKLETY